MVGGGTGVQGERGLSLIEVICALAVVTVCATAVCVGERGQLRDVRESVDELAASRAAAGRLELLAARSGYLFTGSSRFEPGVPGCTGREEIRRVTTGLYEVTVTVRRQERELARLTTLLVTREKG